MTATYDNLELHLAPLPLSRKHVNAIRACCGSYSECRSPYASRRYVLVPASEHALINDLVRTYGSKHRTTTMIARSEHGGLRSLPAWVVVQDINPALDQSPFEQFASLFAKAYVQATARGIIR